MSDVMLIGVLRMPLDMVFPEDPDPVMAFQIHARMGEAADRIESDEKEITRLLAIEVAAKEAINQCFCIGLIENTIQCECCKAEAETLKDFPHKPDCPVLVINPIGDQK